MIVPVRAAGFFYERWSFVLQIVLALFFVFFYMRIRPELRRNLGRSQWFDECHASYSIKWLVCFFFIFFLFDGIFE